MLCISPSINNNKYNQIINYLFYVRIAMYNKFLAYQVISQLVSLLQEQVELSLKML